jgi:DNA-binding winged helix-turn-helix (wHTH) protein/tetratricopeptide (TPR) repeat protein
MAESPVQATGEFRVQMTEEIFRFGQCSVHVQRRQVVLADQPRPIEPRPFDLLVHLIRHCHRVVSTDELLDHCWENQVVSVGVVARAILKARQAIGDQSKESPLIRTHHRAGYRFVAALEKDPEQAVVDAPTDGARFRTLPGTRPKNIAVALLPFENLTGHTRLSWIELGLMSLVGKTLGADPRISVVSAQSLTTAMATLPAQASAAQRAEAAVRILGAQQVVHVQVGRSDDQFHLDYAIGNPLPEQKQRLSGVDLIPLGQQLAGALELALFSAKAKTLTAFSIDDPLGSKALARAMQALAEQEWKQAIHLFRVVLDIEPDNTSVQIEKLYALASMGNEAAFQWGTRLLDRTRADKDTAREAYVHHSLGCAYRNKRLFEPAQFHLREALRLADLHEPQEWVTETYLSLGSIAIFQHKIEAGAELLERARQLSDESGNALHKIRCANQLSWMNAYQGNLVRAIQYARDARDLAAEHHLVSEFADASSNLAGHCAYQGLFAAAVNYGEEAFRVACTLGEGSTVAPTAHTLCWLYRETRAPEQGARIVAALEAAETTGALALPGALMARGQLAASQRDHERAAVWWGDAVALSRKLNAVLPEHVAAPWLITSLIQSGQHDEATAALAQARARPSAAADASLQASLRHCEALQLHSQGHTAQALALLLTTIESAPMGAWRAVACLDAAWLCAESGQVADARKLVRDLGPWMDEHPVGVAVDARLSFAQGNFAAAHKLQQHHLAMIQSEAPDYHVQLGLIYEKAAAQEPHSVPPVPPIPWLPSRA